jgi:hypothetical protein
MYDLKEQIEQLLLEREDFWDDEEEEEPRPFPAAIALLSIAY